jgi:anti-sigma factor RsiW
MSTCRQVGKRRHDLASRPPDQLPAEIQRHLAACPACRRTLAALRMTRGLLAVLADAPELPPRFVDRVLGGLPVGHLPAPRTADPWRPAWGLVPAFAALVAGLVLLNQFVAVPPSISLLPTDDWSLSEEIAFGVAAPQSDLVLAALLEGDAP